MLGNWGWNWTWWATRTGVVAPPTGQSQYGQPASLPIDTRGVLRVGKGRGASQNTTLLLCLGPCRGVQHLNPVTYHYSFTCGTSRVQVSPRKQNILILFTIYLSTRHNHVSPRPVCCTPRFIVLQLSSHYTTLQLKLLVTSLHDP